MTLPKPSLALAWRAAALAVLSWQAGAAGAVTTDAPQAPPSARTPVPPMDLAQALQAVAGFGEDTFRWIGREMGQERIVKGAPYCADAVHESIQPLADGNRIVERRTTRLCRDGEGRTRQEVKARDGRQTIYLRDPVAGESWVLDPQDKTARRSLGAMAARLGDGDGPFGDSAAWRDYAHRLREWARQMAERAREAAMPGSSAPPAPPVPAVPPAPAPRAAPSSEPSATTPAAEPVVVTRHESTDAQGRVRDVEVHVLRLPQDPPPLPGAAGAVPLPPPAVGLHAARFAPRGPGSVTPLPPREIDGVRANGERTTWTIEAGRIGNEKPIVITREVWTSPDLMLTLSSRDVDPRSGEINYRLQNLRRGEPDPALFKVPADYDTGRKRIPRTPASGARG